MFYLLLLSGASFVAAGAILAAEARVIEAGLPMPRMALALLAAFAVTHGGSDWAEMARLVDRAWGGERAVALATVHLVLLGGSYALLLGASLTLLGPAPRRFSFVPAFAFVALAAWGVALVAVLQPSHGAAQVAPSVDAQVVTRWVLGLPASVCAALALFALAPSLELESWIGSRLVRGAGIAFLVHAAADALGAILAVPSLELLETGAAAAIAILLSETFVFQTSQRLRREETHLRDDFIALVAHELGNPVAALELATERLELCRRASRVIDPRLADDVRASTLTLRRIATDLIDTSRVHARELEISPARVEVGPALERAAAVASAHAAGAVGRPVTVSCPGELPPALADPARLDQIPGNLLTNASKYASLGSTIAVSAEATAGEVMIRVVNEGPCVERFEASRIFSRSYRTRAGRTAARGLGLGLYVARALVEAQGGRIWVESRDHRTAFCVTLPQGGSLAAALASGERSTSATG